MPHQYPHQFGERVVALVQSGREVRNLANELAVTASNIYRWQRQARIAAGESLGVNSEMALGLADAKRRIRDLE